MTLKERLPTKDCLTCFGIVRDGKCNYCDKNESLEYLLFECQITKFFWKDVLGWLNIHRTSMGWKEEKKWIINQTKKKGWHRQILKIAFPRLYMRYGEVEMGSLSLKRNWILV